MNRKRRTRVYNELKTAEPVSMNISFLAKSNGGIINYTIEFRGMPALLFESGGERVVKNLPFNQLGAGATQNESVEQLREDFGDMIKDVFEESGLVERIDQLLYGSPADLYWEKWDELSSKQKPAKRPAKTDEVDRVESIKIYTPELGQSKMYKERRAKAVATI